MDLDLLFKILGALGLLLITMGVVTKNRVKQDIFFIVGGTLLEIYSIYLRDAVFVILQIVFTVSAIYDLQKQLRK
ncbi:MAG: hypothetical protein V1760_00675 [Candidatus Peregrinibacteria bacterium]